MSDTMLHGVLNMPLELWADDPMAQAQLHGRCAEASERIRSDAEEIDRLKARVAELEGGLSEALEWNWIDHVSAIEEGKYSDIQDVADRLTLLLQHDRTPAQSLAARDARVKVEALRDVIRKYTIKIVEDDFDRGYSQVLWEIQHDASRIEKEAGL